MKNHIKDGSIYLKKGIISEINFVRIFIVKKGKKIPALRGFIKQIV
jgi:hypothetical protein